MYYIKFQSNFTWTFRLSCFGISVEQKWKLQYSLFTFQFFNFCQILFYNLKLILWNLFKQFDMWYTECFSIVSYLYPQNRYCIFNILCSSEEISSSIQYVELNLNFFKKNKIKRKKKYKAIQNNLKPAQSPKINQVFFHSSPSIFAHLVDAFN